MLHYTVNLIFMNCILWFCPRFPHCRNVMALVLPSVTRLSKLRCSSSENHTDENRRADNGRTLRRKRFSQCKHWGITASSEYRKETHKRERDESQRWNDKTRWTGQIKRKRRGCETIKTRKWKKNGLSNDMRSLSVVIASWCMQHFSN